MKRCFTSLYCVLICCVILFSLTIPAYAAGTKEYRLDELGMTVSMPSDYIVFLRDIDENDPNLSAYGLTIDSVTSFMNERNIYLDGWNADISQEILITMVDSPFIDFNLYSDPGISLLATMLGSIYEDEDITVIKSEIYQHTQAKFIKMYNIGQTNEGSTMYTLQYLTVYADKTINITMQSHSGQITESQEAVIKSIVDSAKFDTALQTAETYFLPTDAFTYTDTKTGATFLVPANWVETSLTEEREIMDVEFSPLEEVAMFIQYGSVDLWEELPESESSGFDRSDIDIVNSYFTNNEYLFENMLNEVETFAYGEFEFNNAINEIETVTYGGNEYRIATETSSIKVKGYALSCTFTWTCAFCVENGYMHLFIFTGGRNDKLYGDFVSLLASMEFPSSTDAGYSETTGNPQSQSSIDAGDSETTGNPRNQSSIDVGDSETTSNPQNQLSIDAGDSETTSNPQNQSSIDAEYSETTNYPQNLFSPRDILLSLIITISVYSLPIIIYRYAIRSEPVETKDAKKITIIYGICAFIAMSAIAFAIKGNGVVGGSIVLWSWVNYRVLIGGKKEPVAEEIVYSDTLVDNILKTDQGDSLPQMDDLGNSTSSNGSHEKVCHNCGSPMPIESKFCYKCGAKME